MLTPASASCARQGGHPARPIVDLGQDRLALDERVAAFLEDGLRGVVVGGGHDHVARVADPAAADRPKVDAAGGERLCQVRHGTGLVLQLDDELVGHQTLRRLRWRAILAPGAAAPRVAAPRALGRRQFRHDGEHDQGGQEEQALDHLAASRRSRGVALTVGSIRVPRDSHGGTLEPGPAGCLWYVPATLQEAQ